MALFKKAVNSSAYLKAGLMGFAGSGKTRTATELAIGMMRLLRERGLKEANRPIMFFDTETGSDYVAHLIKQAGFELETAKSRAFVDLKDAAKEAEDRGSFLIIDSITHVWREFCAAYQKKKNRSRLEFQDWAALKLDWGIFTDQYINTSSHIALCGRAGYEYDMEANEETGKKELQKTGVKMKAEGEMGYEPSLLLFMEAEINLKTKQQYRVAHVLKCRFDILDGKDLCDENTRGPTFEMFLPHINMLNLGGAHLGVDTSRNSSAMFADNGSTRWQYEKQQKSIALDEVREELLKMHPGQAAADKKAKGDLLEMAFGTRSWEKVETLLLDQVKVGRDRIWQASRGHAYGQEPGPANDLPASYGGNSGLELAEDEPKAAVGE